MLAGVRQWIPEADLQDPVEKQAAGLPEDLEFATKGELAIEIVADALADGLWFDFLAETRSTGAARSCGSTWKPAARPTCCGSRPRSPSPSPAARHRDLRGHRPEAAEGQETLGGPLRGERLQGRALVRLGAGRDHLPAAHAAHPPPVSRHPG